METRYYLDNATFLVSTKCIVFGFKDKELYILLARRTVEPMLGEWSLMGGFVAEDENVEDTAKKILYSYTQQKDIYIEQVKTYGETDRDSGGRVISVAYYALVCLEKFDASLAKKHDAKWINLTEIPDLIFDHNEMVEDALTLLRYKVSMQPVIFKFFSEKFTLPALQSLYEAIYQKPTDKRNFRNKIASMDVLDRLDIKDTESSKRGAFYYIFNEEKYKAFLESDKCFSL